MKRAEALARHRVTTDLLLETANRCERDLDRLLSMGETELAVPRRFFRTDSIIPPAPDEELEPLPELALDEPAPLPDDAVALAPPLPASLPPAPLPVLPTLALEPVVASSSSAWGPVIPQASRPVHKMIVQRISVSLPWCPPR